MNIEHLPDFWEWINEREKSKHDDEAFQPIPLYKEVEMPEKAENQESPEYQENIENLDIVENLDEKTIVDYVICNF